MRPPSFPRFPILVWPPKVLFLCFVDTMEFGGLRSSFDCLLIGKFPFFLLFVHQRILHNAKNIVSNKLLADLDDTLYSSSLGIAQACKRNIEGTQYTAHHRNIQKLTNLSSFCHLLLNNLQSIFSEFLAAKCRVSAEKACFLRVELFHSYGSSLAGLIVIVILLVITSLRN